MTEPVPRPIVRPRFLKWSLAIFVLLLPLVVHAVWDYLESSRLAENIARIRENNEPVTSQDIGPRGPLEGEAAYTEQLYRAAAALAHSRGEDEIRTRFSKRVQDAVRQDEWPADLVALMRGRVTEREEAFRLLDLAAPRSFQAFSPGTSYNYRTSELMELSRLAALRTRLLALDGDDDAAAKAVYSEFRLARTFDGVWSTALYARSVDSLATLINHASPSATAWLSIESALKALDRDDWLKNELLRERAVVLDAVMSRPGSISRPDRRRLPLPPWIVGPWLLSAINRRIETLAAQIEVAHQPWPRPLDAVKRPFAPRDRTDAALHQADEYRFESVARALALVRCARVAVAASRYRLDRRKLPATLDDLVPAYLDAVPIDPFSGQGLRYSNDADSYSVYSVKAKWRDGSDLGIRIRAR